MNEANNTSDIVFIMGIMPRSGTHFLANLLCLHPDCKKSVLAEDGLVASASFLTKYANFNYQEWQKDSLHEPNNLRELLLESLGDGLLAFLQKIRQATIEKKSSGISSSNHSPKYLVTKTPQVIGLEKFFKIFPKNKLLILVRDGRSVVESGKKSFNYEYETLTRQWRDAADRIIRFENDTPRTDENYLIVKYEELHTNTEQQMRSILSFMNLDPERYDFKKALEIPVVGSSVFKRGDRAVNWLPVSKTADFDPLARANNWTRRRHERFNWIARSQLVYFGYQPINFNGNKNLWLLFNYYLDTRANLIRLVQKFTRLGMRILSVLKNNLKATKK